MGTGRKRTYILHFRKDLKSAGQSSVRRVVEITVCSSVGQIRSCEKADRESTLVEIVEFIIAGRLGSEEIPPVSTNLIYSCRDFFAGRKLSNLIMVLEHTRSLVAELQTVIGSNTLQLVRHLLGIHVIREIITEESLSSGFPIGFRCLIVFFRNNASRSLSHRYCRYRKSRSLCHLHFLRQ